MNRSTHIRSTVAKPQLSPHFSSMTEFSVFIATAGSIPARRNFSRMSMTSWLSFAASGPQPIPSESITHSTPASVLKYVPLSPLTFSPFFFIAAIPTDTARGSASISVSFALLSALDLGLHSRIPNTVDSLSR